MNALAGFVDGKLPEEALREEMSATAAPAPAAANVAPAATMVPGVAPVVGGAPQNLQQAIAMQIQASNALLAQLLVMGQALRVGSVALAGVVYFLVG